MEKNVFLRSGRDPAPTFKERRVAQNRKAHAFRDLGEGGRGTEKLLSERQREREREHRHELPLKRVLPSFLCKWKGNTVKKNEEHHPSAHNGVGKQTCEEEAGGDGNGEVHSHDVVVAGAVADDAAISLRGSQHAARARG